MLSRKCHVMILSLLFAVVMVSSGYAQDKVVVVPLSGSSKMTVAAAGGDQTVNLTTANPQSVRSVTITAPVEGIIIVNASCYVQLTGGAGTNPLFRAYINDSSTSNSSAQMSYGDAVNTSYTYSPVSGTRAFAVAAGTYTYYLYVDMWAGTAILRDSSINALFVPVNSPVITTATASATAVSPDCVEGAGPDC